LRVPEGEFLAHVRFSCDDVFKKLKKLKSTSSPGPDGLRPGMLTQLAPSIAYPISQMFEQFFNKGFVPNIWKLAYIKPILKSGDPSMPSNYRPISLTCVLCKIMEGIIRDQMLDFLYQNEAISKHQHGF